MGFDQDEVDRFAKESRFSGFDPRMKLGCVIAFVWVVAFMRDLTALWVALTFILVMIELSGVPLRHVGRSYLLAFPFILFAALAMLLTAGAESALTMGMRISASVLALLLLISTTPFFETMRALRWYHVPTLLCNLILFTYRFIWVLIAEMGQMRLARKARGFSGGSSLLDKHAFTTITNTIGMVFVRAHARAVHIYDALLARGYTGEVRSLVHLRFRGRDLAWMVTFILVASLMIALQLEVMPWTF